MKQDVWTISSDSSQTSIEYLCSSKLIEKKNVIRKKLQIDKNYIF